MTDIAIQLEGVSLDYPKQKSGGGLLREVLTGRFRKTRDAAAWHRAIDQLDLTVNRGEVVGVMGPNGSGKSTILDALTYVLFNKPFRRVNLPQLINTQNRKGLRVEVEFKIGNNEFLVCRGMKPKLFEVFKNGEILEFIKDNKDLNLETASEFLLMATWLAYLKSKLLLPEDRFPPESLPPCRYAPPSATSSPSPSGTECIGRSFHACKRPTSG